MARTSSVHRIRKIEVISSEHRKVLMGVDKCQNKSAIRIRDPIYKQTLLQFKAFSVLEKSRRSSEVRGRIRPRACAGRTTARRHQDLMNDVFLKVTTFPRETLKMPTEARIPGHKHVDGGRGWKWMRRVQRSSDLGREGAERNETTRLRPRPTCKSRSGIRGACRLAPAYT
ncbi:hypothetical protein EVAR_20563_1 [Eumeta japonica]|uniref:Uncharacterized protein n=1 Tax=Eumeta variegata TaxID=151549 RepID=A0A4C1URW1_EUMVA|nr:hypothetical protein EVAR_20563_1 [Eumeta japonica]